METFMPSEPSETLIQSAHALCEDEHVVSDDSGLNNRQKWARVCAVFRADKATLFSGIDYAEIYLDDVARTCEAASFICDLRLQFIGGLLNDDPGSEWLHKCYVEHGRWLVRLHQRVVQEAFCEAAKHMLRAH